MASKVVLRTFADNVVQRAQSIIDTHVKELTNAARIVMPPPASLSDDEVTSQLTVSLVLALLQKALDLDPSRDDIYIAAHVLQGKATVVMEDDDGKQQGIPV